MLPVERPGAPLTRVLNTFKPLFREENNLPKPNLILRSYKLFV
jgi:hypothetical protein